MRPTRISPSTAGRRSWPGASRPSSTCRSLFAASPSASCASTTWWKSAASSRARWSSCAASASWPARRSTTRVCSALRPISARGCSTCSRPAAHSGRPSTWRPSPPPSSRAPRASSAPTRTSGCGPGTAVSLPREMSWNAGRQVRPWTFKAGGSRRSRARRSRRRRRPRRSTTAARRSSSRSSPGTAQRGSSA